MASIAPDKAYLIQALFAEGCPLGDIVNRSGASLQTVKRYAGLIDDTPPRRDDAGNPPFDPRRDEVPDNASLSLTARICGDPYPGRRELVARHVSAQRYD